MHLQVWETKTLRQVYSIYPHKDHDIGDVYSVAYASVSNTVYLGTQNGSILWYDMDEKDERPEPSLQSHPYQRQNRFFDSTGPGGIRTPRPVHYDEFLQSHESAQSLEIDEDYIHPFAHFGYVYSMLLVHGVISDDPKQELLVTGGGEGNIKLWSLDKSDGGAPRELIQLGHSTGDSVLSLVLDGSFLISGTIEGRVKVWDLEARQMVRNLRANVGEVLALSVGQGCLFVTGSNGQVEVMNP